MTQASGTPADPRRWVLATSSSIFGSAYSEGIQACKSAGLSSIELVMPGKGVSYTDDATKDDVRRRAQEIADAGLNLWSVHIPFGVRWDISSTDDEMREMALAETGSLLDLSGELGAEVAVIHASYEKIEPEERGERFGRSKSGLAELARLSKDCGLTLAVECLPRTCIGNSSTEIERLLDGAPDLRVCFDANHLLQETSEAFARRLGGQIITVHISDYDGLDEKHWLPGKGVIDWTAVISNLAASGYSGPWLFEVGHRDVDKPYVPSDLAACWGQLLAEYLRCKTV